MPGAVRSMPLLRRRLVGIPNVYVGLTALYVLVRIYTIAGTPVGGSFPDSATYRQGAGELTYPFVSLTGRAMRPWVVPLLYAILPSDAIRTNVQVAISVLAWLALATAIALTLRDKRVRVASFVVVLAMSCTSFVIGWDKAIGSESVAISFAVLALAAWIRFATKPSMPDAIAVIAATTCWTFFGLLDAVVRERGATVPPVESVAG